MKHQSVFPHQWFTSAMQSIRSTTLRRGTLGQDMALTATMASSARAATRSTRDRRCARGPGEAAWGYHSCFNPFLFLQQKHFKNSKLHIFKKGYFFHLLTLLSMGF